MASGQRRVVTPLRTLAGFLKEYLSALVGQTPIVIVVNWFRGRHERDQNSDDHPEQ